MTKVEELIGGRIFKWAVVDVETDQIVSVCKTQIDAEEECLYLNDIARQ